MIFVPVENGVIGAEADGTVVSEDEIGDGAEGLQGFFIGMADRSAGWIAASHDEQSGHGIIEAVGVTEEEHVKGGVGEHEAELCGVGSNAGGKT